MTLMDFVKKYTGKKVDFDGVYGAQCVDLARQYFKDVWELPRQPEGVIGAQDFFLKHDTRPLQIQMLNCIACQPGINIPPEGAVILFRATPSNQYGHIGICVKSGENAIILFEQNGFAQDGAKFSVYDYSLVLGWLVKKEGE
jgi:hypothetical protein